MPNWVTTEISITCGIDEGDNLVTRCHKTFDGHESEDALLSNFVNLTSVIEENNDSSDPDWYFRNLQLLGTKWDAAAEKIQLTKTGEQTCELRLVFRTAWDHPFPAIKCMAEQFFRIKDDMEMRVEFSDEDPDANFGAYTISTDKEHPDCYFCEGFHVTFFERADFDEDGPLRGRLKDIDSYKVSYSNPKLKKLKSDEFPINNPPNNTPTSDAYPEHKI